MQFVVRCNKFQKIFPHCQLHPFQKSPFESCERMAHSEPQGRLAIAFRHRYSSSAHAHRLLPDGKNLRFATFIEMEGLCATQCPLLPRLSRASGFFVASSHRKRDNFFGRCVANETSDRPITDLERMFPQVARRRTHSANVYRSRCVSSMNTFKILHLSCNLCGSTDKLIF